MIIEDLKWLGYDRGNRIYFGSDYSTKDKRKLPVRPAYMKDTHHRVSFFPSAMIPPKVEYSLTEKAETLLPVLEGLCEWGAQNRHD